MSGLEEIIDWVEDNYGRDDFVGKDTEEIYAILNKRFEDDGRSDLDHILGRDRKEFLNFIRGYFRVSKEVKTQAERIQHFLSRHKKFAYTPKQIALSLGLPQPSVRRVLQTLTVAKKITRIAKGIYAS